MFKIRFAGAAGEVTGSKHLLSVNGKKILLDCGLHQGHRKEADFKNRNFKFNPEEVDAIVLSHAHMDHSGSIPLMTKNGFKGPIFCTHATRDLCSYMLMDSAYIQEREIEWMKKKKKNEGLDLEPLYTTEDAMASMKLFQSADYEQKFEVIDGVYASFYDAGHILGSGLIHLEISDQETGKNFTLTFTGDLGRAGLPILKDPKIVPKSDIMITESTYGNRLHAALDTVEEDLAHVVNEVCEKGGKLIIPAFALERSQEIVYHLHLLMKKKAIPYLPIYVDSPLAGNVTEVFRTHQECFDKETCEEFVKNGENPFGFSSLTYTRSVEESKALNEKNGPMIIISASGMCEHGRILHHLKNNIDKEQNTVLIVGYQAENTLGRKLVNGNKQVNIFGAPYQVRASVYVMDAFSAHADRSDLLDYHSRVEGIKKMFLVHGEETQLNSLKANLEHNGFEDVYIPEHGEEVEIDINKLVD